MCASYVYKRRKLQNSVALLSKENGTESNKGSGACNSSMGSKCIPLTLKDGVDRAPVIPVNVCAGDPSNNGGPSVSVQPGPQNPVSVVRSQIDGTRDLVNLSKSMPITRCYLGEGQLFAEASVGNVQKLTSEYNSVNDSCSSSKSNMEQGSALMKIGVEDAGECSSSDILVVESSGELASAKELCISVLGRHGQHRGGLPTRACISVDVLGEDNANLSQSCKVCGLMDNPLKMLICDLCEEAFHLSCCKVKKLPVDEWYCQPCFRKKPKILPETVTGKLFNIMSEENRRKMLQQKIGPISIMLKDTSPYTSGVRIGKDFQAEVPDWSGPISNDSDCFGEPTELDPDECDNLNVWNFKRSSRPSSIGNWLQCREVVYKETDENDEGVVCGKWRRAPLYVSQTEDWDCSCSVLWDQIHADCAVPQELETSEVLKHLKYIELVDRQKDCADTRN